MMNWLFRLRDTVTFRACTLLTLIAFMSTSLPACVSTRARRTPTTDTMDISYAIYLKQKDYRNDGRNVGGVLSELHILRDGQWELLARSSDGSGTYRDVIPGQYRLRVLRWAKASGEMVDLEDDNEEIFRLKPDESANVRVVLEKTPTGLIIVLSVTVIVLIVALVLLLAQNDVGLDLPGLNELPLPPAPDPSLFYWLPPPDLVVTSFMIPYSEDGDEDDDGRPADGRGSAGQPEILDYYPLDGQQDVDRTAQLWIEFARPIDSHSLDHRNFTVKDRRGNTVPGGLYASRNAKFAYFRPLRPLSPDHQYEITVYGAGLRGADGRAMQHNYRWAFSVR